MLMLHYILSLSLKSHLLDSIVGLYDRKSRPPTRAESSPIFNLPNVIHVPRGVLAVKDAYKVARARIGETSRRNERLGFGHGEREAERTVAFGAVVLERDAVVGAALPKGVRGGRVEKRRLEYQIRRRAERGTRGEGEAHALGV